MSHFAKHFGLPLLTKELIEQSARKRTYILRFLYAVVLYGTALWAFQRQLGSWNANGLSVLGRGRDLYISLAWLQFAGIYIFLPAMTCSVLTAEKERDTLGLLLLTKLGPWTIVFEKLFSRLVPMATFVLLSMPLLAVSYSLGGVESNDIAKLMWILAITAIQVGSFAVLCSAWFRTTAGAFLATYILGTLAILISGIYIQIALRMLLSLVFQHMLTGPAQDWLFQFDKLMYLAFGPAILNGGELLVQYEPNSPILLEQTFLDCLVMTLPMLGLSMLSLLLARSILWRRAFIHPKNILMKFFRSLDGFFQRVNQNRLTRGIVLIRESVALPFYHPISWRETAKRSLGTTRYLIRMLLVLEIPVIVMALWPIDEAQIRSGFIPARITECCLWVVAALVLTIQSTSLIGLERSRQTLDVLLTIPVESDEIIRQKFAGIWRLIAMLWVPFATIYLYQMWWHYCVTSGGIYGSDRGNYFIFTMFRGALAVSLYLPAIAWFGFYEGLHCRSQTQAILVTMTMITAICVIPLFMVWFVSSGVPTSNYGAPGLFGWTRVICYFSPAAVLSMRPEMEGDWILLFLHFFGITAMYLLFWYCSRKSFARRVGRNDGIFAEEEELAVAALGISERLARLRSGRIGAQRFDDIEPYPPIEESR